MEFLVHMLVEVPTHLSAEAFDRLKAAEREMALDLQRRGVWTQLWRVVGEYANYSVFNVESNDALHDILSRLPLFPFMRITVTPLARHPSKLPDTPR